MSKLPKIFQLKKHYYKCGYLIIITGLVTELFDVAGNENGGTNCCESLDGQDLARDNGTKLRQVIQ